MSATRPKLRCEFCNGNHWRKNCPHKNVGALIRSSDMVVLLTGWRERAQKCRDEAHDLTDWENPGTAPNRLLTRAKALDDCARELEIAVQHNKHISDS